MEVKIYDALIGQTMREVVRTDNVLGFVAEDRRAWRFYHEQNCCESVTIEDICGDLDNLVGAPILQAEEVSTGCIDSHGGSVTWTFYKFATCKGAVVVRWLGSSNGYYSESVHFEEVKDAA